MKRRGKAVGIVAALFACVFCVDACVKAEGLLFDAQYFKLDHAGEQNSEPVEGEASIAWTDALLGQPVHGGSLFSDEALNGEADGGDPKAKLPEGFEEEFFAIGAFYDVQVDESASVIGFLSYDSADEVFRTCSQELEEKGWTAIASGQANAETFVKREGTFKWAFISCLEVAGETSLVVQLV